jgi:hypothetical protein
MYYIDPIPKAYISTMLTQIQCPSGISVLTSSARIDGCLLIPVPGSGTVQLYSYVSDLLQGATHQYWWYFGWLMLTLVLIRAISVWLFKTVSHLER